MTSPIEEQVDPSVCYRHPDRQSWVLCQRCGRTICPECQILAPVGVQCPECVREAGGSVRWRPTGGAGRAPSRAYGPGSASVRRRPAWMRRIVGMLRPDGGSPVASWSIAGAAILLWVVGLFTSVPFDYLSAQPSRPLQIWGFVTGIVAYPSSLGLGTVFFAISMVFWFLNAPGAERTMGRARFLTVVLAATIVGNAAMVLFGSPGFGIGAALFGIFASYLIAVWDIPSARNQVLIMLLINLVISLFFGGFGIPAIIGGGLAGAGAEYLLRWFDNHRPRAARRTAYLIVFGGAAVIAVLAIIRSLAVGGIG